MGIAVYKSFGEFTSLILTVSILVISYQVDPIQSVSKVGKKLSEHPVLIVVSFDGFRYDYMTKTDTPTLRMLQKEGISVPYMQSQFPTKTFPNHHSIATGLYPDVHGVIDNVLYDPIEGRVLSGFKDDREFWYYKPEVVPFWIRNEEEGNGRISGCYMWAGSTQAYGNSETSRRPTHFIPKYNGSVPWEDRVETVLGWMTDKDKPANVIFMYHHEPDSTGHKFGTDGSEIVEEVKQADQRVSYLVQRLKDQEIFDKVNLVILGDHGMMTVPQENIINVTAMVDPALYDTYGGSPLMNIKPKDEKDLDLIYEKFKAASNGKQFHVYKKSEMSDLKYGTSRRVMDIVLLADPGYGFDDLQFKSQTVVGSHGYDNRNRNMTTIFIARGPAFKKGYESSLPIDNIDLFSLFSKIVEIPTAPNNGSFTIVKDFLVGAGSGVSSTTFSRGLMIVLFSFAHFYQ